MSSRSVRVGVIQHACGVAPEENRALAARLIRQAAEQGAQLVCLQELFTTPYFCQVQEPTFFELAEPLDGPTVTEMSQLAKELGVTLLVGLFERRAPGLFHNSVLVIGPTGETLGVYRKMHIPEDPQFEEKYYFAPGDLGFLAVETPHCTVGPLICWDQWYPEAARLTAMQGAEILFYPTAIGWLPEEKKEYGAEQLEAWQIMHRSHSIANGVFTVAVNRVGIERSSAGQIEFWGNSFVVNPAGQIIAKAGEAEEVLVFDCPLGQNEHARQTWPFFRDRRVDAYQNLSQRWGKQ